MFHPWKASAVALQLGGVVAGVVVGSTPDEKELLEPKVRPRARRRLSHGVVPSIPLWIITAGGVLGN